MNKSQEAYVRSHVGLKSIKELVEDTEATAAEIKKFIKTLNVEVKPKPKPTSFHTHGDIVAMTASQSADDDKKEYVKTAPKTTKTHVFVMDPNKPVR